MQPTKKLIVKMSVHLPMLRALNDEAANKLIDEFLLIVA